MIRFLVLCKSVFFKTKASPIIKFKLDTVYVYGIAKVAKLASTFLVKNMYVNIGLPYLNLIIR
jgi:hypothetical protein